MQHKTVVQIEDIRLALSKEFNIKIKNLERLNPESLGDYSQVFFGNYEGKKIFIKTISPKIGFDVEAAGLSLLNEHGIPVPKVLAYSPNIQPVGQAIIILSEVPGIPLSQVVVNPEIKARLYQTAGTLLQKIHEIRIEGFGELTVVNGKLQGTDSVWSTNVEEFKPDFELLDSSGFVTKSELEAINTTYEEILKVVLPRASFMHNDSQGSHIYTEKSEITGIIDLGAAFAGDPRHDIAMAHFFLLQESNSEAMLAHFNAGYGKLTNDPLVAKYLIVVAAKKLSFRLKEGYLDRAAKAATVLKRSLQT